MFGPHGSFCPVASVRKMRLLLVSIFLSSLVASLAPEDALAGPQPMVDAVRSSLRGVNVNGYLDTSRNWNSVAGPRLLPDLKALGFTAIRLPFQVTPHLERDVQRPSISSEFLSMIDQWLAAADESGLRVILDLHDARLQRLADAAAEEDILQTWKILSQRYSGRYPDVHFEILNEPHGAKNASHWASVLGQVDRAIRSIDPKRSIVVSSSPWSAFEEVDDVVKLSFGAPVMFSFHYYAPMKFTHQGANWTKGSKAWLGTRWGTARDLERMEKDFRVARDKTLNVSRNFALTEFGAIDSAVESDRLNWIAHARRSAEAFGWDWYYWALNGVEFGIYVPEMNCWRRRLLDVLVPKAPLDRLPFSWCK